MYHCRLKVVEKNKKGKLHLRTPAKEDKILRLNTSNASNYINQVSCMAEATNLNAVLRCVFYPYVLHDLAAFVSSSFLFLFLH